MTSNSASRIAPCAVVPFAPVVCTRTRASRFIGCGTEYPHSATSALPFSACRSAFASVWSSPASVKVASLDVAARRGAVMATTRSAGGGGDAVRGRVVLGGREAAGDGRRRAATRAGRPGRMHVPSDAFQGRSPEIAARDALEEAVHGGGGARDAGGDARARGRGGRDVRGAEEVHG